MTIKSSGSSLSFSEISAEFGSSSQRNMGAYRVSTTIGEKTFSLDEGIPSSGPIRFSDFYGKRLNVVIDCGSGARIVSRSLYNTNDPKVTVIGGLKSRPSSSSGTRIWIYTNGTITSDIASINAPNRQYCSLLTGGWESDTDLRIDIGSSGFITGAGGNGGNGGTTVVNSGSCYVGRNGRFGTSAIGVQYQPVIITNRGRIQGGTGGGGGGGTGYGENRRSRRRDIRCYAGGGGGGGGMGIPAGSGGSAGGGRGGARAGIIRTGRAGAAGGPFNQGAGGLGSALSGSGAGATGGTGGSGGNTGGSGSGYGFDAQCGAAGGSAGFSGYAIIITNNGTGVTITNNGTEIGGRAFSLPPS